MCDEHTSSAVGEMYNKLKYDDDYRIAQFLKIHGWNHPTKELYSVHITGKIEKVNDGIVYLDSPYNCFNPTTEDIVDKLPEYKERYGTKYFRKFEGGSLKYISLTGEILKSLSAENACDCDMSVKEQVATIWTFIGRKK